MLVTSSYKKNDIIGIKLSTGEEVVARFDKFDSSTKDKTKRAKIFIRNIAMVEIILSTRL